jgi:hypothetical protein
MKKRILIITTILVAFILTSYVKTNMFIADSPRINPMFISQLINSPKTLAKSIDNGLISMSYGKNTANINGKETTLPPLKNIAKGVRAGENKQDRVLVIEITEDIPAEINEVKMPDGRVLKVVYPKLEK